MPIPLGILAAAGFRPPTAAGAYEHIETYTVGAGGIASVTFDVSSYSSTYQHLQIRAVSRGSNTANAYENIDLRFNGDTGNNYAWHLLSGYVSGVISENSTSTNRILAGISAGAKLSSGIFSPAVIDILDPYEAKNKTIRHLSGSDRPTDSEQRVSLGSGAWFNTASVTSIVLAPRSSSAWAQYSRFSIYGLKAS